MMMMTKDKAITSDQMYKIEDNGHNLIGMRRVYMMENAGHGLADFIITKFKGKLKGKKIVVVCGNELNDQIKEKIAKAGIIIDGIFGTGIKGGIREPYASVIELINKSKAYVVSI